MALNFNNFETVLQTKLDTITDEKDMLLLGKAIEATVGNVAVSEIQAEGTTQTNAVTAEGGTQISAVQAQGTSERSQINAMSSGFATTSSLSPVATSGSAADLSNLRTVGGQSIAGPGGDIATIPAGGTVGQVVTNTGSGTGGWADAAGGGLKSQQVFNNPGSFTWTRPSGVKLIKVYVTGGGAGGGGGNGNWNCGGGGAAGGTSIKIIDVSAISTVSVTVGAGGARSSAGSIGHNGTTSSFGGHCSGAGGERGRQAWAADGGQYSRGGAASGGSINLYGGDGGPSSGGGNADESGSGAHGGASYWGGGAQSGAAATSVSAANYEGKDALCYGAGGGGGDDNNGTSYGGGAGKHGIVVVEEYS